ncbi:hypothetical protein NC651_007524 [Populus alba x Populus x berolinensis]|nr:hypothetical protein NC651_007524 [Populus alba x Populus x berolinensis]
MRVNGLYGLRCLFWFFPIKGHPELPCRINEGCNNNGLFMYTTTKYSSKEKLYRQVKRIDGARTTVKKEVSVSEGKQCCLSWIHVQSGTRKCSQFLCADVLQLYTSKARSMLL